MRDNMFSKLTLLLVSIYWYIYFCVLFIIDFILFLLLPFIQILYCHHSLSCHHDDHYNFSPSNFFFQFLLYSVLYKRWRRDSVPTIMLQWSMCQIKMEPCKQNTATHCTSLTACQSFSPWRSPTIGQPLFWAELHTLEVLLQVVYKAWTSTNWQVLTQY